MPHTRSRKRKWYKWKNPNKPSRYIWKRETNRALNEKPNNLAGAPQENQQCHKLHTCNDPPLLLKENCPSEGCLDNVSAQSIALQETGGKNFNIKSEPDDFANASATEFRERNTYFSLSEFVQKLVEGSIIDSSTQPKVIALFENSRPDFRDVKSLRIQQPSVSVALYEGTQCTSCAMRFQQSSEYRLHLKWHLQQCKIKKQNYRTGGRSWYHPPFYYNEPEHQKEKEKNAPQNQDEQIAVLPFESTKSTSREEFKQHSIKEETELQLHSAVHASVDETSNKAELFNFNRVKSRFDPTLAIKEEPIDVDDPFFEVPNSLVKIENDILESTSNYYNKPQDGVCTKFVHSIDGNVEFSTGAPICKSKFKINLTNPVPVIFPTKSHDAANKELKTEFSDSNADDLLPCSVKPALKSLALMTQPIVIKGHELVGVCSVM